MDITLDNNIHMDHGVKDLFEWGIELDNQPEVIKQTINLIKLVQHDKMRLMAYPSLSNIKMDFNFSALEIKKIIEHYHSLNNKNISPQQLLISYSEVQIPNEAILDGCRALVVAMYTQTKLVSQYIVPAISLLMQCEKEAYDTTIQPDNIYRSFFATHIFLLLFRCKLKIHESHEYSNDERVLITLDDEIYESAISILDEVLLGWIDVYMEFCLYSKQWDMIFLLHEGLLSSLVIKHTTIRMESIDFNLERHLIIDKVAATLPLYQHLLTGNLVFPILITLYIAIGYEYCSTVSGWKTYPGFVIPVRTKANQSINESGMPSYTYFKNNVQERLGISLPLEESKVERSNSINNLCNNSSDNEDKNNNNAQDEKNELLDISRLLIYKGLECFGACSTMSDDWLTILDRKLVSWNTPFDVHAALVLCGADFFLAMGHIPNSFSLYSELVDKLEKAWKVKFNPNESDNPSWIQNFGGTRDGTYLDIYKIFTPNLPFRGIYGLAVIFMAYDYYYEASIELATILATYKYEEITNECLIDEDKISRKEYLDESMYCVNQDLQIAFVSKNQFVARCFKKLIVCLEMMSSKRPQDSRITEWMLILIQFGWPYWNKAFEQVILPRVYENTPQRMELLLKYIYNPYFAKRLITEVKNHGNKFQVVSHKFQPGSINSSDCLVELHSIVDSGKEAELNGTLNQELKNKLVAFLMDVVLKQK